MKTEGSYLCVTPDPPMVNFGHCLWKFSPQSIGDGTITVEKKAVEERIRAALTDDVLHDLEDELEQAEIPRGVGWPSRYYALRREIIVKAICG